ncbi:glycosylphosphatidylinositol specific phospholipase D1 [Planoprotostelium fungivorum]|uniref:Phosphatidylinositol-glycan-specific phospholipase D n=1 Tax=Planoprotostelium fungivorum TaxID=1890364 RepID=A0A2P6NFD4_9EUKA|nr:glycosylphosphatidylinositol specific phospholipase D1 [Planoprotostelium fungivorum]
MKESGFKRCILLEYMEDFRTWMTKSKLPRDFLVVSAGLKLVGFRVEAGLEVETNLSFNTGLLVGFQLMRQLGIGPPTILHWTKTNDIIQENRDAFGAGISFPDWGYHCVLDNIWPSLGEASETSHWEPFMASAVRYLHDHYEKPWNSEARKLVAFMMGVVAHDAADTLWHDLAGVEDINQGFIPAMSFANFQGVYGSAHTAADVGGDIELFFTQQVPPVAHWYIPTDALVEIFHMTNYTLLTPTILDVCNTEAYGEYLAIRNLPVPAAYGYETTKATFLVENLHSWWMGGINDMATWAVRCWKDTISSIETGTFEPCVILVRDFDKYTNVTDYNLWRDLYPKTIEKPIVETKRVDNGLLIQPQEGTKPLNVKQPVAAPAATENNWCGDEKSTLNSITYVNEGHMSELGSSLAYGDYNGDGKIELAIGSPGHSGHGVAQGGAIFVVRDFQYRLPGHHRYDVKNVSKTVLYGPTEGGKFGTRLIALDFNLDGYTDLIVSSPGYGGEDLSYTGIVHIFFGGKQGLSFERHSTLISLYDWAQIGSSLSTGDIDGDGNPDLIVASPYATIPYAVDTSVRQHGQVMILLSNRERTPGTTFTDEDTDWNSYGLDAFGWYGYRTLVTEVEGKRLLLVSSPNYATTFKHKPLSSPPLGKITAFDLSEFNSSGPQELWSIVGVKGIDDNKRFGYVFTVGSIGGNKSEPMLWVGLPTADAKSERESGLVMSLSLRGLKGHVTTKEVTVGDVFMGHTQLESRFGFSIGFADFDGDGRDDLYVSQPWRFNRLFNDVNNGGVYVWRGGDQKRDPVKADFCAFSSLNGGLLGREVLAKDVDGDGYSDLILGGASALERSGTRKEPVLPGYGQSGCKKSYFEEPIVALSVCGALVVLAFFIIILVFFLFPRIPNTAIDRVENHYIHISRAESPPASVHMNITVYINVTNDNYVDIHIESLNMNITHKGDPFGTVKSGFVFIPKRSLTVFPVQIDIICSDVNTNYGILQEYTTSGGRVKFRLNGIIVVTYIGVTHPFPLDTVMNLETT